MSQKPSAHNTRIDGIYGCSSPKNIPNAVKNPVKRELKVKQDHVFEFLKGTKCSAKVIVTYITWIKPAPAVFKISVLPLPSMIFHLLVEDRTTFYNYYNH